MNERYACHQNLTRDSYIFLRRWKINFNKYQIQNISSCDLTLTYLVYNWCRCSIIWDDPGWSQCWTGLVHDLNNHALKLVRHRLLIPKTIYVCNEDKIPAKIYLFMTYLNTILDDPNAGQDNFRNLPFMCLILLGP